MKIIIGIFGKTFSESCLTTEEERLRQTHFGISLSNILTQYSVHIVCLLLPHLIKTKTSHQLSVNFAEH